MQPLTLTAEILFLVVFIGALVGYLRRRDPVSRGVALVFSALAVLLVLELWNRLGGEAPRVVSRIGAGLFILQPVFALHLVSLVRRVPRVVLVVAAVAAVATGLPVLLLPDVGGPGVLATFAAFIVIELVAAGYLVLTARARVGPGAVRLWVAAGATATLAAALLMAAAGAAATAAGDNTSDLAAVGRSAASLLALLAAVGFVIAFVPPPIVRRFWQAGTTVEFGRGLLGRAGASVDEIWAHLARLSAGVGGGTAVIVVGRSGVARIAAAATADAELRAATPGPVTPDEFAELARQSEAPLETDASTGVLSRRLAGETGARFVSIVRLETPEEGGAAFIVLLSRYRSLFHASDLELLAALGAQTAIVVERGVILGEQRLLTARLEETVEALRAASEAKSDFLASMSHELRTPLSAILGFSDLMRREPSDGSSVTVPLEWVEHVHRGGEHLLALINDVLDLAKVEAGRLELQPEPIEASSSVAELVAGLRPLADRKRIEVTVDVPLMTIHADRGRFRQILYNLLSNAIKYTPEGGTIRIEVDTDGEETRLRVVDSGVGIGPRDLAAVFEEFRQVGEPGERQAGTGLGLALTRRLVEAHGGRIELASERGRGSTFTVVLPAAGEGATPGRSDPVVAPTVSMTGGSGGTDIFVIEDDPSAVRLLREYLESSGFSIRAASTGEAGLAAMRTKVPNAIILDVLLPGVDGWEVLRKLKEDPQLRNVPVVILTVVDEREVGLALGAVDYLVKPIDREALIACLARLTFTTKVRERVVRVLAVDDEPASIDLIRIALEPEGFEVIGAAGGREALERAAAEAIDVVVCDLVMPDVDGFEVVAGLKADPRTAALPILVYTAHDLSDADKTRLNGKIMGIVTKGPDARDGLRAWLATAGLGPA